MGEFPRDGMNGCGFDIDFFCLYVSCIVGWAYGEMGKDLEIVI